MIHTPGRLFDFERRLLRRRGRRRVIHTPGRLFDFAGPSGYDAFFSYGPGAMAWTTHPDRALWFLAPGVACPLLILPMHAAGNWTKPGDVPGWDGNIPATTFHPSIHFRGSADEGAWHGYIIRGQLYSLPSTPSTP